VGSLISEGSLLDSLTALVLFLLVPTWLGYGGVASGLTPSHDYHFCIFNWGTREITKPTGCPSFY
jgi:hypothetical protein